MAARRSQAKLGMSRQLRRRLDESNNLLKTDVATVGKIAHQHGAPTLRVGGPAQVQEQGKDAARR